MQVKVSDLDVVCVVDPARTRESEYVGNARFAIGTTGMDVHGNVFALDTWAIAGPDLANVKREMLRQCQKWHPRTLGIESVATQTVFADIAFEMLLAGQELAPITELKPDTREAKKWRIKMQIQRVAPFGRLFFAPWMHELRTEYIGFPRSQTIDLMDQLAYAIMLLNPPVDAMDDEVEDDVEAEGWMEKYDIQRLRTRPIPLIETIDDPELGVVLHYAR